jgi:cbb3-type cytochrome oxidase subunit 3
MYTAFYRASQYLDLATVSSIFFAVFFTCVVIWVLVRQGATFERAARLPLEGDDEPGSPATQISARTERQP